MKSVFQPPGTPVYNVLPSLSPIKMRCYRQATGYGALTFIMLFHLCNSI